MVKVMATAMALVLAFLLAAGVGLSEGAVYKVGDAAGWTIMGSPNYTAWALSKKFEVGNTIVFEYNKSFHNVLEVSKADYRSCNAASPIATFATGNDSITIKTTGHHYFICGIPGHCGGGQKVDIKISNRLSSSAAPSTSPTASPSASPATSAPAGARGGISIPAAAPGANSGTRALPGLIALALSVLASAAVSGGLAMNY